MTGCRLWVVCDRRGLATLSWHMRAISFQAGREEADEAPGDGLDLLRGEESVGAAIDNWQ